MSSEAGNGLMKGRRGLIMGLAHKSAPIHSVQFHPESIETEHGHAMLENFVKTL